MSCLMVDGNGKTTEMNGLSVDERLEYISTFLHDDRAKEELKEVAEHIRNIMDSEPGDDLQAEAENLVFCLEAICGYESGHFKGNNYWIEVYWDNYKRWYQ